MAFFNGMGTALLAILGEEPEGFYVAWFDVLVVLLLLLAFRNGKKHGISEELLAVLQWLVIAGGCALINAPLGRLITDSTHLSAFWSQIVAYALGMLVVVLFFQWIKRMVGGKLLEADYFGRHEYSLGIIAAMTRYLCILLVGMALLNSRHYSRAELLAIQRARAADEVKLNIVPTMSGWQHAVFIESQTGKTVKKYLPFLLIPATDYDSSQLRDQGEGRKREKLIDDIIGGGKAKAPSTNTPPTNAPAKP
ncbi:MAG: CvpA family protein [Verrucomicrobia bacterium]|nr:CvpA family protein [Verrucomicrobiota bacterium]